MAEIKILNNEIVSVSTGKLGVGTTSPGNLLHIRSGASGFGGTYDVRNKSIVEANGEAYYATYVPDNSFSGIRFFNTSGLRGFIDYYHGTQGDALVYSATNHHRFLTNGVERVRLIQNGYVGIGTTSPSEKLHVSGSILANSSGIAGTVMLGSTSNSVFADSSGNLKLWQNWSSSSRAIVASAGAVTVIGDTNDNDSATAHIFTVQEGDIAGGNTRMVVTKSGNVGIGTTSPTQSKLVVAGDISIPRNNSLVFLESITGTFRAKITSQNTFPTFNGLEFYTGNDGSTPKMTISDTGNVGIGTTSPSTSLHVVKDASWEVARFEADSYPTATVYSQAAAKYAQLNIYDTRINSEPTMELRADTPHFNIRLDSTGNVLTILDGGNVGIGTTSPSYKLDVAGDIYISNGESLYLGNANSRISSNSSSDILYFPNNNHIFGSVISGADVERMRITEAGNVGIGTTSPSNLLHIHASGNNASALIIEDDDRRLQLGRDMIESRSADGSTVQNLYIQPNGNTAFATTSGNVGIGTTSPGAKLDVRADAPSTSGSIIYVRNTLADGANSTFGGISFFSSPGTDYSIGKLNTGIASALAFRNANNGTEYMRIDSSGNVGIGTTSPAATLHISKGSNNSPTVLRIENVDTTIETAQEVNTIQFYTNDGSTSGTGITSKIVQVAENPGNQYGLSFYTYDLGLAEALRITNDGNVGIGTTSPSYKLDVSKNATGYIARIQGDTNNISFYDGGSGGIGIGTNVNQDLKLYTSDSLNNGIVIKASGDVGIGTTSPFKRLHVVAQSGQTEVLVIEGNDSLGKQLILGYNATGNGYGTIQTVYQGTAFTNLSINSSGGNVGIGTTSPAVKLQVSGNASVGTIGTPKSDWWSAFNSIQIGDGTTLWGRASDTHLSGNYYVKDNSGTAQDTYINTNYANDFWLDNADGTLTYRNAASGTAGTAITWNTRLKILNNGNVGIGTTSPARKLTVNAPGAANGTQNITAQFSNATVGATSSAIYIGAYTGTDWLIGKNIYGTANHYNFEIGNQSSGSSPVVSINNSNNVGIGTTSPLAKVDVRGDLTLIKTTTVNADFGGPVLSIGETTSEVGMSGGIAFTELLGTSPQNVTMGIYYDGKANKMHFTGPNDAEATSGENLITATKHMTITRDSGLIGIGIISPSSKLDVNGVIKYGNNGASVGALSYGSSGLVTLEASSANTSIGIIPSGTGNVGIGTTSPSEKLHVEGGNILVGTDSGDPFNDSALVGIQGTTAAYFQAKTNTSGTAGLLLGDTDDDYHAGLIYNNSTSAFTFNAGNNTRLTIDGTSGNVGIGTTSPGAKLDVNGVSRISGDFAGTGQDPLLEFYNTDASLGANQILGTIDFYQSDPSGGGVGVVSRIRSINDSSFKGEASLTFHTGEANVSFQERMRITSTGNVGIGTTSPDSKLHIESSSATGANLILETTHSSGIPLLDLKGSHSAQLRYKDELDVIQGRIDFGDSGIFNFIDVPNNSSTLYLKSGGNVGIGTTNPGAKLDVTGGSIQLSNSGSAIYFGPSSAAQIIGVSGASSYLSFGTIGTERMRIDSSGNVGIGTNNPQYKLTVSSGTADIGILTASSDSGSYVGFLDNSTSTIPKVGAVGNKLILDASQYVGVRRTDPSYALDVSGTIRATGDVIAYSDARVKENVETIPNALDKVKAMRGVGYNKIGAEKRSIGVIAQEMLEVMPEVVSQDEQGMYSVAYGNLVGVLIEAMKEQQAQIDELKAQLNGSTK